MEWRRGGADSGRRAAGAARCCCSTGNGSAKDTETGLLRGERAGGTASRQQNRSQSQSPELGGGGASSCGVEGAQQRQENGSGVADSCDGGASAMHVQSDSQGTKNPAMSMMPIPIRRMFSAPQPSSLICVCHSRAVTLRQDRLVQSTRRNCWALDNAMRKDSSLRVSA